MVKSREEVVEEDRRWEKGEIEEIEIKGVGLKGRKVRLEERDRRV